MKNDTTTTSARVNLSSTHYNTTIPSTKRSPNHVLPDLRHSTRHHHCHLPVAGRRLRFSKALRSYRASKPQDPTHLQRRASTQKTGFVPTLLASLRLTSRSRHDNWRRPTTRDSSLEASTTDHLDDTALLLRTHAKCAELCYNIKVFNQRSSHENTTTTTPNGFTSYSRR